MKKVKFSVDDKQAGNVIDLCVGCVVLAVVILTLTFGQNFNNHRLQQFFNDGKIQQKYLR